MEMQLQIKEEMKKQALIDELEHAVRGHPHPHVLPFPIVSSAGAVHLASIRACGVMVLTSACVAGSTTAACATHAICRG